MYVLNQVVVPYIFMRVHILGGIYISFDMKKTGIKIYFFSNIF